MNQQKANIISSIFFIILAAALWLTIPCAIQSSGNYSSGNTMLDSRFFPRVLVIMLSLSSLCNILMSILSARLENKKMCRQEKRLNRITLREEVNTLFLAVLLFVFAYLMNWIGFLPAAIFSSSLVLVFLRVKKWQYYVITVGFCFVVYFIFVKLLYVVLP